MQLVRFVCTHARHVPATPDAIDCSARQPQTYRVPKTFHLHPALRFADRDRDFRNPTDPLIGKPQVRIVMTALCVIHPRADGQRPLQDARNHVTLPSARQ